MVIHVFYSKEKMKDVGVLVINQVPLRILAQEGRNKCIPLKYYCSNVHMLNYNTGDDENIEVYAAKYVWPTKAVSHTSYSLKPINKNHKNSLNLLFYVFKCDRIFACVSLVKTIEMHRLYWRLDEEVMIIFGNYARENRTSEFFRVCQRRTSDIRAQRRAMEQLAKVPP